MLSRTACRVLQWPQTKGDTKRRASLSFEFSIDGVMDEWMTGPSACCSAVLREHEPLPQCQAHKTVESDNLLQARTQFKDKDVTTIHNTTQPSKHSSSLTVKGCQSKKKTEFKKKKRYAGQYLNCQDRYARYNNTRPRLFWIKTLIILNRYSTLTDFIGKITKLTAKCYNQGFYVPFFG